MKYIDQWCNELGEIKKIRSFMREKTLNLKYSVLTLWQRTIKRQKLNSHRINQVN